MLSLGFEAALRSTRLAPVLHGTVWGRSSVPVEQLPALSDFKARA